MNAISTFFVIFEISLNSYRNSTILKCPFLQAWCKEVLLMRKGFKKCQSNEKKWCFVPKHQRILSTHKRHLLKRLHHCLLLHQCTKDGKMKSSEELKVTGTSPPSSPIISYLIWWGSHFSSNKEALNCAVAAAVDFLIQIDPPLLRPYSA